ncbi:MAG TPA: hypothetical protein VD995_07450 [Azospirillum sp.]|nr:hypothetical protein [Azospirillum sp.]
MVVTAEFLGMLLLVASVAALGLSIVFDVGRVSAERARATVLQRQIDKKKTALKEWTSKTDKRSTDMSALQIRLAEHVSRKQKAQQELKTLEFTKIELVHELGECDGAALGYWSMLIVHPDFANVDRREVIFSRQIWSYRNVAHVWAGSTDHAHGLLKAAFPGRSGIQPTQVQLLSMAPDTVGEGAGL